MHVMRMAMDFGESTCQHDGGILVSSCAPGCIPINLSRKVTLYLGLFEFVLCQKKQESLASKCLVGESSHLAPLESLLRPFY